MTRSAAHSPDAVVCPHCKKEFEAKLLADSGTGEPRGFKCPHCRLFVPFERANSAS